MPNFGYNLSQGLGALGGGLLQGLLERPRYEAELLELEEERKLAPLRRLLMQAQVEAAQRGKPRQLTPEQEAFQEWWGTLDREQKDAYQRRRAAGKNHLQSLVELNQEGVITDEELHAIIGR